MLYITLHYIKIDETRHGQKSSNANPIEFFKGNISTPGSTNHSKTRKYSNEYI